GLPHFFKCRRQLRDHERTIRRHRLRLAQPGQRRARVAVLATRAPGRSNRRAGIPLLLLPRQRRLAPGLASANSRVAAAAVAARAREPESPARAQRTDRRASTFPAHHLSLHLTAAAARAKSRDISTQMPTRQRRPAPARLNRAG